MAEQSGALKKPDWIPYYIQRMKGSKAYKQLQDFEFGWYSKLLLECADSDVPGYLVNDVRTLWRLAGARTEKFFRERGGMELVARYFSRTGDGLHIYNERMLEVLHEQNKRLTKRRKSQTTSFYMSFKELPSFIPEELFKDYMEMRVSIKKPIKTARTLSLAVNTLERLKEQGHEPKAVLEQSIFNSWAGLFEVKANGNGHKNHALVGAHAPAVENEFQKAWVKAGKPKLADPQCQQCGGSGWNTGGRDIKYCECRVTAMEKFRREFMAKESK